MALTKLPTHCHGDRYETVKGHQAARRSLSRISGAHANTPDLLQQKCSPEKIAFLYRSQPPTQHSPMLPSVPSVCRLAPVLQVDKAVNKSFAVYKQGVNSPGVQNTSKKFDRTRDAVYKQFTDSINLVQDKGLTGTFYAVKQKAFDLADEGILFAKRGRVLSKPTHQQELF